jgi:hypothetical protein
MKNAVYGLYRPLVALGLVLVFSLGFSGQTFAGNPPFPPESSSGSVGIQGEISTAPPTRGASISTPSNGAVFNSIPITVAGICPSGLLVKIFANNVFVGSTICVNGSYSLQIDLFSGQDDLVAIVYDALDQAGPDSNSVTVTFNDAQFLQFGTHVELNSNYAERGAAPNTELDWPIILSGGTGPYAISVDWGDGSPTTLLSEQNQGTITLTHTYKSSGIYYVIVKATDKNGGEAFLQLVAVSTGASQNNNKSANNTVVVTKVIWWPALAEVPLLFAMFWIGRRHELFSLRKQLEKTRDEEARSAQQSEKK